MSYKFTLRDVVLEASEREFFSTMPDYEWVSSEKHTAAIKKLFEDKPSLFDKIKSTPLYKGLAVAAAVVTVLGALIAIKPVREAVASLFDKIIE